MSEQVVTFINTRQRVSMVVEQIEIFSFLETVKGAPRGTVTVSSSIRDITVTVETARLSYEGILDSVIDDDDPPDNLEIQCTEIAVIHR